MSAVLALHFEPHTHTLIRLIPSWTTYCTFWKQNNNGYSCKATQLNVSALLALADCPPCYIFCVCLLTNKIQMQISWVGLVCGVPDPRIKVLAARRNSTAHPRERQCVKFAKKNCVYYICVCVYVYVLCIWMYICKTHSTPKRECQDFAKTEWDEVSAVPVYMTANSPQTASTREAIREKRPISGFVSPGLIQSVWLKVFKIDVTKFIAIFNNLIPLNCQ